MAHDIYKLENEHLAARLAGTVPSWHKLEKSYDTLGEMWNATQGRVSVQKLPAFVEWGGKQQQLPRYALAACFDNGTIELADAVGSEFYTVQDLTKVYDLVGQINEVYPCDYIAVLNDGFQTTFSFNIGEFATADGQQHYSRFLFSTINDKSGADLFNLSNIRVVCRNTYAVALSNGVTRRFRHTAGIDARVAEVANPMISQRLSAAIEGQQEYIAFYNDLLALPAPNADLFFETVFGKRPDEGRAKAQWETKVDGFKMALSITEEETPELANTAAFWFNAATRSQQTRRTRQRDPLALNGGMALAGVNSDVVDLATAFFMRAIKTATVALPSPIIA